MRHVRAYAITFITVMVLCVSVVGAHAAPAKPRTNYCGASTWITVANSGYASMGDDRWIEAFLQEQVDATYHSIYCGSMRSGANVIIYYNEGVFWCLPDWHNWYQNSNDTHFQDQHNTAGQCTPANPDGWHYQTIGNAQAQNTTVSYQGVAYFDTWPSWAHSYVNVVTPWYRP